MNRLELTAVVGGGGAAVEIKKIWHNMEKLINTKYL